MLVIYSPEFLNHKTGPYHPERPQRLEAIVKLLQDAAWANQLTWQLPTQVKDRDPLAWINLVHQPQYLQTLQGLAESLRDQERGHLDPDTVISGESYQVALLAVNAWLDGVSQTWNTDQPSFVLARPPGHHALPERGMGFCLLANAAIAAHYALSLPGISRVAILDWDVHHGNGTQACVESLPNIAYCSLHQSPHYPYTGASHEQGQYQNVLNIPLDAGSTGADYHQAMTDRVIPFLKAFNPDLLLVSAGYDAHRDDPLSEILLTPGDYAQLTQACLSLTRKTVFGLEGGYDLGGLATSVRATVATCLGQGIDEP
ncbi:histone deacetylase [Thermosynechococcaceae cyanobacterium BACA0444]|uniref:Histone deacetylase n=1 Tax=Pseudocalidococcus azoricus BACA0444 TaxID=2918990 RepID=A0AAE4FQU7_9CYAN|nr:histone deacetylase [Pseudocalidococcus azoricus]MDS3860003.1 histone deacetylase [Pseudocalidococcus azoricus BACA0444]